MDKYFYIARTWFVTLGVERQKAFIAQCDGYNVDPFPGDVYRFLATAVAPLVLGRRTVY